MALFNFFKKEKSPEKYSIAGTGAEALVNSIITESLKNKNGYSIPPLSGLSFYQEFKKSSNGFKKLFFKATANHLSIYRKKLGNSYSYGSEIYNTKEILQDLFSQALRSKTAFTDEELLDLIQVTVSKLDKNDFMSGIPFKPLISKIQENIELNGLNRTLKGALELLLVNEKDYSYHEIRNNNQRIKYLLNGSPDIKINGNDELGKCIAEYLNKLEDNSLKEAWSNLIDHLISAGDKSAPSKKWQQETHGLVEKVGVDVFTGKAEEWLRIVQSLIQAIHKNSNTPFLTDVNHNFLKALIWTAGTLNKPSLNNALDEYGQWALKKLAGVGVISLKTGNACIFSFSILPFKDGISRLTKFKMKIKHSTVLKQIDKCIKQISEREGYSEDEFEEMGVPDFGIDQMGVLRKSIGDYVALFQITGLNPSNLLWEKEGKRQSSVPTIIKNEYKDELSKLKKKIKEIEGLLPSQRGRIEQSYLKPRSITYQSWLSYYLHHPLISVIARKLIWTFINKEKRCEGIYFEGKIVDSKGDEVVGLQEDTEVQLWHPLGYEADYVLGWRNFLIAHRIVQPFKQAFREIYLVTDAELNTQSNSNRFAAHILRQHQFAALCRQRRWHYTLQGNWDSHNTPYVILPHWNIRAEFFIEADHNGTTTDMGIFNYVFTDQVRFYDNRRQLDIQEVSPMVFTEVMRDIDLFVGVTSIGNDPTWQDGASNRLDTYWREYSFGELSETSKMRESVLKTLIPRLKIASKCTFDGKFLKVRGEIRDYKIHMGSGNILMSPNDEYLCIVPDRKSTKDDNIFLPFEGDNLLSIIISKAFLLAEDTKIKDPTITGQLKRGVV